MLGVADCSVLDVLVVAGVTYFVTRNANEKFRRDQTNRADNIIAIANENARTIELEAKDKALRFIQEAEDGNYAPPPGSWPEKKSGCKNAAPTWITAWNGWNSANRR